MAGLEGILPAGHRYCSTTPARGEFSCSSILAALTPCCRSSFLGHPLHLAEPLSPQRCQGVSHCLHCPGLAWKRLSTSVGLANNIPVLVRGEQDGFYYRGTVKEEMEGERGLFLVEFAKPLVSHGRHPVCVQKAAKDDILEYVNGMKHSLLPGDKVLAPWEPEMARYGPGTILTGIETRDPLRASEDEEITVQFWNNKKVKLPLGVALWIPPGLWERTIEMIHMPFTSRVKPGGSLDPKSYIFCCSLKPALVPVCAVHSLAKHCLFCSPCWPHFHHHCDGVCCSSAYVRCICCSHPHIGSWWSLPSRSLVFQSKTEDAESSSKPSPLLLELKGPNQDETAAVAASSLAPDSGWDLEPFPTESTVVDGAGNTDSGCPEKPRLKDSARPQWKSWKSSHHKSHPSNSGLSSTCTKGKLESKAIPLRDMSHVAPSDRSAMFGTVEQFPGGQLTKKEILRDQDSKLSSREEGFAAPEKQRYKTARRKMESDDKHQVICIGNDNLADAMSEEDREEKQQRAHLHQSRERERHGKLELVYN